MFKRRIHVVVVIIGAVLLVSRSHAAELVYSLVLNGQSGQTTVQAVAVDAQGNAYVAGDTSAVDFPVTAGAFQPRLSGAATPCGAPGVTPCFDGFVAKLDSFGKIVWATFLGGARDDSIHWIAVDPSGSVYVAGKTWSPDFPVTRTLATGVPASFIAKLSPDGASLVYSFLWDGGEFAGLGLDARGSAYVAGPADTAKLKPTPGAFRTQPVQQEAFVGKLNQAGSDWVYLTFLGGSGNDNAKGIAVDASGDAYVAGFTDSQDFPGVEHGVEKTLPVPAMFVAKLNPAGSALVWATYLRAQTIQNSAGIAVDTAGSAYLTPGGHPVGLVIQKLSPDGSRILYSKDIGIDSPSAPSIVVNGAGEACVVGYTASRNLPVTPGAVEGANYVGGAGYVLKLDAAGSQVLYASYIGGESGAGGNSAAVDPAGFVYAAGERSLLPVSGQKGFILKTDLTQTRPVWLGSVVNAASYRASGIAPGEVVTLFGTGLGPAAPLPAEVSGGRVSTKLGDTEVLVNGVPVPLLYVSSQQINAVVPFGVDAIAEFAVRIAGQLSNVVKVQRVVKPGGLLTNVGIFTRDGSGRGQAAVLNQDGTLNSPENPAPRGTIVAVWLTGAGATDPPSIDGRITPEDERAGLVNSVGVSIHGSAGAVKYAGAAPGLVAGIAQINFQIPDDAETGPAVVFFVRIGSSLEDPHFVTMAVR